ncbi:MAG: DUF5672 family protein [Rikenellaceae bacterium]
MQRVIVVIPLYQQKLPELELKLLLNNLDVLKNHPIALLMPESLALDGMREQFDVDKYNIVRISDEWLGRKNGIAGYNRMMLSEEFYSIFSDYEYMLVCQTDAVVFRDELLEWCDKGYDYIGAPWPKKKIYSNRFISAYLAARDQFRGMVGRSIQRQDLFNKVGNGGFSLRRVAKSIEICREYKDKIDEFCNREHTLYNEDVFWAIIPEDMKYPTLTEALKFSIDIKPEYCFELAGHKLPFGVHGLTYKKYHKFWIEIIPLLEE